MEIDNKVLKGFIQKPGFKRHEPETSGPKISIIVPSYNQGPFLERTILSILNQNYANTELLIIDGGSNDNTRDIIYKYEENINYWQSEKDNGQSDALNKGFLKAAGDIIGWQNSDDIYLPGAFHKAVEFFTNWPETDILYGNRLDINEEDEIIGKSIFTKFSYFNLKYEGILLGTQSAFFRKRILAEIGLLQADLHLAMDYEFFLRALLHNLNFRHVPFYLGAMRRHSLAKTEMFLGRPKHNEELNRIYLQHGRDRLLAGPLKACSMAMRSMNYILQGDMDYVLSGIKRRLRGIGLL